MVETYRSTEPAHLGARRAEDAIAHGRQWSLANTPVRYRDATVEVPEVAEWVAELVRLAADPDEPVAFVRSGPSLLLYGVCGTGKTHNGYGALHALSTSGAFCGWVATPAADLYARLRPRHGVDSEAVFERHAKAPVLMLDDLGAAKGTDWVEEVNYRLINYRYEHELPTLVTSNHRPRELAGVVGERVASRLAEMTTPVTLEGPDRRYPNIPGGGGRG